MIYKIVMLLLIVVANPLQETKDSYFLESWKKGKEKIEEKQFNVELDPKNPRHEFTIKTKQGQPKYKLIINTVITSNYNKPYIFVGNIGLIDNKKKEPINLLKAYAIDTDCFGCNDIGIIHPEGDEENGYLAYNSRRIIKIESFYCVITTNNCKIISVGNKKFFESVNLTIDFTNQYFFSEEPRKYPVY